MIGSGNINSYGTHTHEHTVTRCLHTAHDTGLKSGGAMSGGLGASASKTVQPQQESFSLTDLVSGGWKSFVAKSFELLGKVWEDGAAEAGSGTSEKGSVWTGAEAQVQGVAAGEIAQAAEGQVSMSAEVLAGAVVRTQGEEKGSIAGANRKLVTKVENSAGGMAGNTESAADGKLRKEQEEVKKFLLRLGKTAAKIRQPWRDKEEAEKEVGVLAGEDSEDFIMGDSSYLLDSYNSSGEYSTLAKDRSREGKFRAMG